ncbi:MAG: MBL fold metallo-hydrolase [Opitutales bacterium]|nr:MBL fold metallo-hydrolase [Opitutales bacterium]MDG1326507.1 MBL fold metallo-hydrolase [Opitutales bacterium]
MKLIDLNPHGGIGANCTVCEVGGFRFAIDSGLHPKYAGKDSIPRHSTLERDTLDFIILTHCHLDHLGSLPLLSREHQDAPVLMSYPSSVLARRMLSNSISVMKRQRNELNLTELPLYGRSDLTSLYDRVKVLSIKRPFRLEKDGRAIEVVLHHAGHVAGAVSVEIKSPKERILFTGDILFDGSRTLDGAEPLLEKVDTLVTETTRGLSIREPSRQRESEMLNLLEESGKTLSRGGSVLIPVFALGRMQEMLSVLDDAFKRNAIPKVPVFCSGLGMDLVNHFHEISKNTNRVRFNRKVLRSLGARPLPRKLEPGRKPPMQGIYLVSSGMLVEHTPSYVMASSMLGDERNSILFVGYCDPSTPGGQLLQSEPGTPFEFNAYNHIEPIKAKVRQFDLSGHADRDQLVAYAEKLAPKNIFLHHGDPEAREWFTNALEPIGAKIINPEPLQFYET